MEPLRYSPHVAARLRRRALGLLAVAYAAALLAVIFTFLPGTAPGTEGCAAPLTGAQLRWGDGVSAPGPLSPRCFFGGQS